MQKIGLIKKIRSISKLITSKPGEKSNCIHILPNTSRSKGNQTIKFGQLIEYNMTSILLENSCTKFGGETSSRPFTEI